MATLFNMLCTICTFSPTTEGYKGSDFLLHQHGYMLQNIINSTIHPKHFGLIKKHVCIIKIQYKVTNKPKCSFLSKEYTKNTTSTRNISSLNPIQKLYQSQSSSSSSFLLSVGRQSSSSSSSLYYCVASKDSLGYLPIYERRGGPCIQIKSS